MTGEAWRYLGPVPERPTNPFAPSVFLWLLRILWVALAVVMGFAVGEAVDGVGGVAGAIPAATWWLVVAVSVVALVVQGPIGLTVVRLLSPATVPAAIIAWVAGAHPVMGVSATALAAVTAFVAMSGDAGAALVQAASYGHERRFPLRMPAALVPPVVLAWVVWSATVLASVVLLAHAAWLPGAVLGVAFVVLTWFLLGRFHRFSRRWLVLVPAGVVVHDPVMLGETLMVQRTNVAHVQLALADTEAADLTGPAGGMALDIAVREMVLVVLPSTETDPKGRAIHVQSFLIAPSRPGRALQAMADARLPLG